MDSAIVKLNVGGVLYTTTRSTLTKFPDSMLGAMFSGNMPTAEDTSTRSTLTKFPDSMLGAMFSGKMPTTKDENGHYFIDRDGDLFRYVLEFLRSSEVILPCKGDEADYLLWRLKTEADFYQITALIEEVKRLTDDGSTTTVPPKSTKLYKFRFLMKVEKYITRYGERWKWKTVESPRDLDNATARYTAVREALLESPEDFDRDVIFMKLMVLGAQRFDDPLFQESKNKFMFVLDLEV